jgi:hypothetical protein
LDRKRRKIVLIADTRTNRLGLDQNVRRRKIEPYCMTLSSAQDRSFNGFLVRVPNYRQARWRIPNGRAESPETILPADMCILRRFSNYRLKGWHCPYQKR